MAFPVPTRTNQRLADARQRAVNARQRIATMRGQMFPTQNPGLQPPQPPPPPPAPRMAAAAPPQQPQAPQQTNRSAAPKPTTQQQQAALANLGQIGSNFAAGPGIQYQMPAGMTPPPQSTPPPPVGPGEISDEDIDNAPYMSEDYFRTDAAETRRREQQLAAINQQRQALGIGYGLGEFGGDAENNPYSRAALLQRNYERNQRASTNSMAAAGQLYSGSLSNARNFNRFNYDVGYDSMRKQYDAALARLNQQELEANTRYDDANEAALRDAVNQGQIDEAYTPEEAPEGGEFGGGGGNAGGGGGGNAGGGGNRPNAKKVVKASKQRLTAAQKRINQLKRARSKATNPKQKKNLTQRIQNNQRVVRNNKKRIKNVKQGKPPNQGMKPAPKPKKGKKK